MSDRTADLLAENLESVVRSAHALDIARARCLPLVPLTATTLPDPEDDQAAFLDAFAHRFQNTQDILSGRVFRGILAMAAYDLRGKTPLDIAGEIAALQIVESAEEWREFNDLRNDLAHEYPLQPARQADRFNRALIATPRLLEIVAATRRYGVETLNIVLPPTLENVGK